MNKKMKKISLARYKEIKEKLKSDFTDELKKSLDQNEFDDLDEETNDIWDTPNVDSKSVILASPIIEAHTGVEIDPKWIQFGGYDSIEEAVTQIMEQLELELKLVNINNQVEKE